MGDDEQLTVTLASVSNDDDSNWLHDTDSAAELAASLAVSNKHRHWHFHFATCSYSTFYIKLQIYNTKTDVNYSSKPC